MSKPSFGLNIVNQTVIRKVGPKQRLRSVVPPLDMIATVRKF